MDKPSFHPSNLFILGIDHTDFPIIFFAEPSAGDGRLMPAYQNRGVSVKKAIIIPLKAIKIVTGIEALQKLYRSKLHEDDATSFLLSYFIGTVSAPLR